MHQCFATRQHHLANFQFSEGRQVPFDLFGSQFLLVVIGFPDIAHHAAAIAAAVGHHYEYWELENLVSNEIECSRDHYPICVRSTKYEVRCTIFKNEIQFVT